MLRAQQSLFTVPNVLANFYIHKATTDLNFELLTLVEDKDSFKDSISLKSFDQKCSRDHIEAIKSLEKTTILPSQPFQRSHLHTPWKGAGAKKFNMLL